MPQGKCFWTISRAGAASRASKAASSKAWSASRASSIARRSGGRGRLPTWVVRIRSVLSFIGALPSCGLRATVPEPTGTGKAGLRGHRAGAHRRTVTVREACMTEYRFCTVVDEARLRIVTINRPEVMNALHSEAHHELEGGWDEFAADPELWVGIVTGAGERAFSAGNDLKVQAAGKRGPVPPSGFAGLNRRQGLD